MEHVEVVVAGGELPGRALAYERARVIGGCSAHDGCTVSWGHRADSTVGRAGPHGLGAFLAWEASTWLTPR